MFKPSVKFITNTTVLFLYFQLTVNGEKQEADVDDVIKIVEDLTRMH